MYAPYCQTGLGPALCPEFPLIAFRFAVPLLYLLRATISLLSKVTYTLGSLVMKKFGRYMLELFPLVGLIYRTVRDCRRLNVRKMKQTPYGFMMVGQIEHEDIFKGQFEALEIRVLKILLDHVKVFVDVGANVGLYTMLARQAGKRVIAFEPLDQNLRFLYKNLFQNGYADVEVYPVALSSQPGVATIYGASMMASLIEKWGEAAPSAQQTVAISSLDIILGDRFSDVPMLIKVDVEGHEYDVLMGSKKLLGTALAPIWLVEIGLGQHHPDNENVKFKETFNLFFKHGYKAYAIGDSISEMNQEDVERISLIRGRAAQINYLFTKDDLETYLRDMLTPMEAVAS